MCETTVLQTTEVDRLQQSSAINSTAAQSLGSESTVLIVASSTPNREVELFDKTSTAPAYLAMVRTGRLHSVAAVFAPVMFDFSTAAPSQDTIRSTAHTARTIAWPNQSTNHEAHVRM